MRIAATAGAAGAGAIVAATAFAAPANAIIGGTEATEDYAFMTAVLDDTGEQYCGGALVDEQWVLTAGHCADLADAGDISVRVGSNDYTAGGSERGVERVVLHPDYESSEELLRNDLALMKLDAPVDEVPLDIATGSAVPGDDIRPLGWGMVDEVGEAEKPTELRQLDSEIVDLERCAEVDDSDLCSEHPTDEAAVCTLDSGGPVLRGREGEWELAGVVSRDGDYDESPLCVGPQVFTDPVAHSDWITATMTTDPRI